MDSERTSSHSSTPNAKLDEKLEEENDLRPVRSARSTRSAGAASEHAGDLEKGPESEQDNQDDHSDEFLVKFEPDEPANPRNWNPYYKAFLTFMLGMLALTGSLGSSIIAPAQRVIANEFNVSIQVTVLVISLYVLGFALGPSCWAPISEVYGRKISILPATFILGLFSIGTAASHTAAGVFITRFFGGVFGSASISNVAGALGDMYEPKARGTAVTFYAVCVVGGPTIGPVIGSALTINDTLGWRWTEWIEAIWTFVVFAISVVTLPELYPPVLLKRKAQRLRKETGDQRYWHPHESQKINLNNIVTKHLSRPVMMLTTEPMITAIAIYASFVYALLYMTLQMFPIVYEEERQWGLVVSTLPFLGLLIGVIAAMFINLANQPYYARAVERNKGRSCPEARLPPMIIGGWLFAAGLFWYVVKAAAGQLILTDHRFGWTANPKVHWIVPTIATCFIGGGFNVIFQQCINFLGM